jgi:hypothetical protein
MLSIASHTARALSNQGAEPPAATLMSEPKVTGVVLASNSDFVRHNGMVNKGLMGAFRAMILT